MDNLRSAARGRPTPIRFVSESSYAEVRERLDDRTRRCLDATAFTPKPGREARICDERGDLVEVLFGVESEEADRDPFLVGRLVESLPRGEYAFPEPPSGEEGLRLGALAWLLSSYSFHAFKEAKPADERPVLVLGDEGEASSLRRIARAVAAGRDLINQPPNRLGPVALEAAALELARRYGAESESIVGADLLERQFPLVHAVGRAASEAPRLVSFTWGARSNPGVTLVGKGVCFDSGGLDIKTHAGMTLMKKDMAGAATALALAEMIMDAGLPVRLRVLLPIVENAISADAFRPGDIYVSRKGVSVEIGNTDAEGRLILADALAAADEESPDLLFVFATLTGAARVALGPDLPPFFTPDDALAAQVERCARLVHDPVWRLPLWPAYRAYLESRVAMTNNVGSNGFAGSIVAALFLARFVTRTRRWAHFDIYGWNGAGRPGRPEGGEIQAARALFRLVTERYGEGPASAVVEGA